MPPLWDTAWILWNPSAGRGRAKDIAQTVTRELERFSKETRFFSTQGESDLIRLASEARAQKVNLVWVAGGDGTVHLAARGLLENGQGPVPIMGILPLGSANDLAFGLDLKPGWWKEVTPRVASIDHGWIRCGPTPPKAFVNGVGLGFNAMVTIRSRGIRFVRGLALYTLALLQALVFDWKAQGWSVELDGKSLDAADSQGKNNKWLALSVMNGRREGNFDLAPGARLDDGQFELLAVRNLSRLRALTLLPSLLAGGLGERPPWLVRYHGRDLSIHSPMEITIHADGELLAVPGDAIQEAHIRLEPLGLPVLVGPRFSS